jgi:ankyrin repeat protein
LNWNPPLGSDPLAVNTDGRTALHRAAFNGHVKVCEVLLKNGADPRIKDRHQETCFDVATCPNVHAMLCKETSKRKRKLITKQKEQLFREYYLQPDIRQNYMRDDSMMSIITKLNTCYSMLRL